MTVAERDELLDALERLEREVEDQATTRHL